MKFAIIDLGTNSVRLFIYQATRRQLKRVYKSKVMVRLGDGLFKTGRLNEDAVQRTIKAFDKFGSAIKKHKTDCVRAIATSALREAKQKTRITKPVKDRTGIAIQVISGKREASLIARGVNNLLQLSEEPHLLVDIGGGSTEISIIENGRIKFSVSLPLGAARNQQTFLMQVPPVKRVKGKGVSGLRAHVQKLLKKNIPNNKFQNVKEVIGTSGSIRALRRIAFHAGHHGQNFPVSYLKKLNKDMQHMTRAELLQLPNLEPKRADLILSALIILEEICRYFKCRQIRATSVALKDGLLDEITTNLP